MNEHPNRVTVLPAPTRERPVPPVPPAAPAPPAGAPGPAAPRPGAGEWYDHLYATAGHQLATWERAAYDAIVPGLTPDSRVLDLGCGPGYFLTAIVLADPTMRERAYGFDFSRVAVEEAARHVPRVSVRDITVPGFGADFPDGFFDAVTLLEVVEHLLDPTVTVREAVRLLSPEGVLCCSFPNYVNLPWLGMRVAAELLDMPGLINLQPIDRIYTFPQIKRRLEGFGLRFERAVGATYPPPYLHRLETGWMRRGLDRLGLAPLSFHPVLIFRKGG